MLPVNEMTVGSNKFLFKQIHIKSRFILNGVCVRWHGWVDQERLDGVGCIEYDEEAGRVSFFLFFCFLFRRFHSLCSASVK